MDDITAGVNDKREGVALLSDISDVLKSRGLALNLSKTHILSAEEAYFHFQIKENMEIDKYETIKPGTKKSVKSERELWFKYKSHFKDRSPKSWDKIAKRYITTFGKLQSDKLLSDLSSRYIANPVLRSNYLIYLAVRGYSHKAAMRVLEILELIDPFDDLSLFQISNLITQWSVPTNKRGRDFISEAKRLLTFHSIGKKDAQSFFALLWFLSKYESEKNLYGFLVRYRNIWQGNSFLRRQATASMARFGSNRTKLRLEIINHQAMSGIPTTVSVANQISQFAEYSSMPFGLNAYLFPKTKPTTYPHSKFIVLCSVLASNSLRTDINVQEKVDSYIRDPWHRALLRDEFKLLLP